MPTLFGLSVVHIWGPQKESAEGIVKSKWITHKGTKIFYINVSDLQLDFDSLKKELEAAVSVLQQQPRNSVLGLADFRNTTLSKEITNILKSNAPKAAPYFRKSALIIQLTGFKRVVLDAIGRLVKRAPTRFDNIEEAKDWLVATGIETDV